MHATSCLLLFILFVLFAFSRIEVFPQFHAIPSSKMLTFYRKEPFTLSAVYTKPALVPFPTPEIGQWHFPFMQRVENEPGIPCISNTIGGNIQSSGIPLFKASAKKWSWKSWFLIRGSFALKREWKDFTEDL